jgi:ABC-type nitrate/sulfonate/bicarbonate transport system permease component
MNSATLRFAPYLGIGVVLFAWILFASITRVNSYFIPTPLGVAESFRDEIISGGLMVNSIATLGRVIGGVGISLGMGFVIGVAISVNRLIYLGVTPLLDFARSIPTSMMFPLIILIFGIDEVAKLAIVVAGTLPMVATVTADSIQGAFTPIDKRLYLMIRLGRLNFRNQFMARLQDVLPALLSTSKIAVSLALVLVIVTEMFFTAKSGLGFAAHQAYLVFDIDTMYLQIMAVGFYGVLLNKIFDILIGGIKRNQS